MSLIEQKFQEACNILAESSDEVIQTAGLTGQMRIEALKKRLKGETAIRPLLPTETKIPWTRGHIFVKEVVNDMHIAERSGQWPLSTYGPFSCKPSYPNFNDHSFEEMRCLHYEAMTSRERAKFQKSWEMLLEAGVTKMKALQTPSHNVIDILQELYETKPV